MNGKSIFSRDEKCYTALMLQKFVIQGGRPLHGEIVVSGSKNAALPILCATLLTSEASTITNVPDIDDVKKLFAIFEELGVKVTREGSKATIDPKKITSIRPQKELIEKMRASALLAAPLLVRTGEVDMAFPGGCVLGKRTLFAHTSVLEKFGAKVLDDHKNFKLSTKKLSPARIMMPEASVTATENALMVAAATPGTTEITLAACEPHVQDLCHMLVKMGAKIKGIGTHHLIITGAKNLKGVRYEVTGDYLEAGTFAIAAAITRGDVTIKGLPMMHLDSFWQKFEEAGIPFEKEQTSVRIHGVTEIQPISELKTAIHPSFPTDLQAPFSVLMTQAKGVSKIFETLFEGRLSYLFELEKMGARSEILNPQKAIIVGGTPLRGTEIASCDIRAGAAMVLAALAAKGETTVTNIVYIDRGYEKLDEKLRSLGADIRRVEG